MPLVSLIIPSYNNLELLQKCVDSIKMQTFKDYEVLIMDAKSTDGTQAYLKSLTEPFHWMSAPDEGIYDAMNKGISHSIGEWLYFLGSDDVLFAPNTLQTIFGNRDRLAMISLIIGKIQYDYNSNDSMFIKKNRGLFEPSWSRKLWLKNTIHHQGVFYKKELFDTRKFNTAYKVLADYDFNLELYRSNTKAQVFKQTIAIVKTDGISKNYNWRLYKEEINLKANQSSLWLNPMFYAIGFAKFLLKKWV